MFSYVKKKRHECHGKYITYITTPAHAFLHCLQLCTWFLQLQNAREAYISNLLHLITFITTRF